MLAQQINPACWQRFAAFERCRAAWTFLSIRTLTKSTGVFTGEIPTQVSEARWKLCSVAATPLISTPTKKKTTTSLLASSSLYSETQLSYFGTVSSASDIGEDSSMEEASETESRASGALPSSDEGGTEKAEDASDSGGTKFDPRSKKWSARVKVPQELVRFVVGARGAMKRKLEEETGCRLVIPKKGGKMERSIAIMSTVSEESVNRCQERIELIMMDARERAPYTHFVSLSMAVPEIQTTYKQFVETVLNDDELPESCKEEALFQDAGKLHLTLVMLSLLDSNERTLAAKALESIVEERVKKILDGKPLEAEVRNLEYMNDDPSRVRVLYAGVSSDKLQEVADTIAEGMGEAGYAPRRADVVKIHLTLMNARYAWEKGKGKTRIDATKLVEKYGDFNFGRVTISEVQISSLDEPKDENGHYKVIGTFKL